MLIIVPLAGCGGDPCASLCTEVAASLDDCLGEWGATWEDLGATGRANYRVTCQAQWDAARADLEVRQVPELQDRCTAASDELAGLDCPTLRALYLE